MRARITLVLAASLGLAACQGDDLTPTGTSPTTAAAAQEDLFTHVPSPALNNAQRNLLSTIRGRPSTSEVNVIRLAGAPAALLQHGKAVRLLVSPGKQVVAVGDQVEQRGQSDLSWTGGVQGGEGTVQLVLSNEGVTATVRSEGGVYHIEPLGGGLHAVSRVEQANLPPDHPSENPSGAALFTGRPLGNSPFQPGGAYSSALAAATTQTVLVVYTASAAAATASIGNLIQLAVDETNRSYLNSGVGITSLRVHTAQVTYNESGRSFSQHVNALRSTTDGIMDNVHTLRNTYAADMVVLVVNDSEACGIAAAIKATASYGFAVAHYSCITGYYSFGHEIGHLQGARHDRFVDSSTSPYAYGHGYIPASKSWRTVMAYGNNCNNCTRIQYWSNPNVTYGGVPMGTATYEDNARVLNTTAATVAAFR